MAMRSVRAALLVVLVAASARADAPDRPSPPPPPAPVAPPPGAERVDVELRFPAWQRVGTFRLRSASGALSDEGVARAMRGASGADRPVERVLEGAKGTIVLEAEGAQRTSGFPPVFGRWKVIRGTGAYARLAGGGTFTACGVGEVASPSELLTLVGQLAADGR